MIYQVLNSNGNPAYYDEVINPDALFINEESAEAFISFLKNECELTDDVFSIVPFKN